MVWKPKEKDLSKEEAIALAKKELAHLWIGSGPLIGGVKLKKGQPAQVYPLDNEFISANWIVLFCDPFSYDGYGALTFLKEWASRYSQLGLRFLLVLRSDLGMDGQPGSTLTYLRKAGLDFPVAIDADRSLGEAFRVMSSAKMVLICQGKTELESSAERLNVEWFQSIESTIQAYLRRQDRGLPLPGVFSPGANLTIDAATYLLGSAKKGWESQVHVTGKFRSDADRIVIGDNAATITVRIRGTSVGIVARSLSKSGAPCKVLVELNGRPVADNFADRDLNLDESGLSSVQVGDMSFLLLLKSLRATEHELRLIFPFSEFNPVAMYRICVGN